MTARGGGAPAGPHTEAAVVVELVRGGALESVHLGHLAVVDHAGQLLFSVGEPRLEVYARSAAKPFQAAASAALAAESGVALDVNAVAIAVASHAGSSDQQVEAARVLALAGLDESALACPEALPADLTTLLDQRQASRLAHNCSGKHAAFVVAHTAAGGAPRRYLRRDARIQRQVRERLADATGCEPRGPGVDGCGAPAWRLPLTGLAAGFARLAEGAHELERVRDAMQARPDLVGGAGAVDTQLMQADAGVVAKRGAEAVLAAGLWTEAGSIGLAVKIVDGSPRAAGPVVAVALAALGAKVPATCAGPAVLGGGGGQGRLRVAAALRGRLEGFSALASG